jgi:hypothetical protein
MILNNSRFVQSLPESVQTKVRSSFLKSFLVVPSELSHLEEPWGPVEG